MSPRCGDRIAGVSGNHQGFVDQDICGPMYAGADESWRPKGAAGFGARLLVRLALDVKRPAER